MVSIGVLGISYKTADLAFREAIARGAQSLSGERALFFRHPTVLLSTCNRTEIYFSANDLALAHSDLLAHLRLQMDIPFEHRLYSYFSVDCFFHLCKVAAGLDSAILAETEIQRQVKVAYATARNLSSCLHFVFQKALKVSKEVRSQLDMQKGCPTLYGTLWQLADWKKGRVLLVGYSEINRGLISFLMHKGVVDLTLSTRNPAQVQMEGVQIVGRSVLERWQEFDVIVCASKADDYLITKQKGGNSIIFDLSVPRNVDPCVEALVYNIEQVNLLIKRGGSTQTLEQKENCIWANVVKLTQLYALKNRRGLENVGMELRL